MKPLPAPNVPGNTEWEQFNNAMKIAVSPEAAAAVTKEKKRMKRAKARRARSRERTI
jgi:hypothetical protein